MKPPVYPYFYPLTTSCPERNRRAVENGYGITDETQLAQESAPLFEGHDQPIIHCLGDTAVKNWDDTDTTTLRTQTEIAADYGVDGFIFDTFLGIKEGRKIHEMGGVLDNTFLKDDVSAGLKFGIMSILASPRAALPVSNTSGYREVSRDYDISKATMRTIVDHLVVNYWSKENYIRINGSQPYMSVFVALNRLPSSNDDLTMSDSFEYIKEYCTTEYGINPYLVAVSQRVDQAIPLVERGADAVSSYALLPDFGEKAPPIQNHEELLISRFADWHQFHRSLDVPYVPPVVVGWDASSRGINGVTLEEVCGVYPFTPIVHGSTTDLFERMLKGQFAFIQKNVPEEERYIPINAWNEITEGSALLPRVRKNGSVDFSLLEAIKKFKDSL